MIDWFWVKVGIKGGFAAVISIVCLKRLHPPGVRYRSADGMDPHHHGAAIFAGR